jgi:hypothetical protein
MILLEPRRAPHPGLHAASESASVTHNGTSFTTVCDCKCRQVALGSRSRAAEDSSRRLSDLRRRVLGRLRSFAFRGYTITFRNRGEPTTIESVRLVCYRSAFYRMMRWPERSVDVSEKKPGRLLAGSVAKSIAKVDDEEIRTTFEGYVIYVAAQHSRSSREAYFKLRIYQKAMARRPE